MSQANSTCFTDDRQAGNKTNERRKRNEINAHEK